MSISYFQKGAIVKMDGSQFEMKRELDAGLWQLESLKTGRIVEHTIDQLRGMYVAGKLIFFDDRRLPKIKEQMTPGLSQRTIPVPASVTEENWNSAKLKRHFILAVIDLPTTQNVMEQAIRQAASKIGGNIKVPHWVTVSRWKKTYLRNGKNIYSILVKHLAKGNRTRRYPEDVLRIVEETIEAHYLTLEQKKVCDVLDHAVLAVERENKLRIQNDQLPIPTRRLVETVINAIPAFDRCAAREGRTAAIKNSEVC